MEPLSPQIMHKLVFTILVHGLPDSQTGIALDVLTDALNNTNPTVRELAVVALSELTVPAAQRVAALSKALKDPAAKVRRRAARALGDFGLLAMPALPLLVAGLRDPDVSVRRDCAGTVGRFGPDATAATPGLVAMLAEPETRTRVVAATALRRIGKATVPTLLSELNTPDPEVRERCADLLGRLAPNDSTVTRAIRGVGYPTPPAGTPLLHALIGA